MDISILKDIVIIFALSTVVNFLFTKIKVPTIIGYMLTGILAGPHMFSLIGTSHDIELMAEIGVVLLMFTIGLEFSLKHLIKIRKIVFFGGFLQLLLTAFLTLIIALTYGIELKGSIFIGFITALSSTAVVLKLLQERSELTSNYGRTVLGILIFQDIILIPLLLFTPVLGGETSDLQMQFVYLGIKTLGITALVYIGNKWLMPRILRIIALTKNQELFLMSILLICLSVALLTSEMGMSLAFGAFLAGLMISESEYSHNAFGHLIPFKDTFTSFFFVSIGMLLDVEFVIENYILVIFTVGIVIGLKAFIGGGTAFILGHTFRGTILVGLALSQVGEFSFILVKMGLKYSLISEFYFQLFLGVAIISMSFSPFLIKLANPLASWLLKYNLPKFWVEGLFPLKQIELPDYKNHIVIIGKDSRAINLSKMVDYIELPHISIVFDPTTVRKLQEKGKNVIYGDAVNEPVLYKAHVDKADIIIISVGNMITSIAILEKIRSMNKHAYVIARNRHIEDIEVLYKYGANEVIPEEFETSIELFKRLMTKRLVPRNEVETTLAQLRDEHYGIFREKDIDEKHAVMSHLPNIEVVALKIEEDSPLIGKSLKELKIRRNYGVTVVALKQNERIIEHPDSTIIVLKDDVAYILGKPEQIAHAINEITKNQ